MIDAEYERELTLTKGLKTELNKSLDHLLGEQDTYWTLWCEETDDVAEIYGSVGTNHEAVAEVYSPPRLVKEAKRRGLRAEMSVDITTGTDLRDPEARQQIGDQLRRRRPRLLMVSPPCTSYQQRLRDLIGYPIWPWP